MRAVFRRVSPAIFAEKIGIPLGWCVISHRYMPDRSERRNAHGRWFKLSTDKGCAYRVLRFSANLDGAVGKEGVLVLDWPGWLDLNGRTENLEETLEVTITKARWCQYPALAVAHPDPAIRWGSWMAIISLGLGLLSIFLGSWSIWNTYWP